MQIGCWIAVISLSAALSGLMLATSIIYGRIVDEINAPAPKDQRIRAGDRTRVFWALRRHAQMFPKSHESLLVRILAALAIFALVTLCIVALVCFGSVTGQNEPTNRNGINTPDMLSDKYTS